MPISISHAYPIKSTEVRAAGKPCITPTITEPFTAGRSAPRLLFDFGVMASLMKPSVLDEPVLDFGSGTGWVSEFGARMGLQTVAFDIHGDLQGCLEGRVKADSRIDPALLNFSHGDGHAMPFEPDAFGHLLCYDTLHHMHDYPKVFAEFFRVLQGGGARHLRGTGGTAQHFARNSRVCSSAEKARPKLDRARCGARGNRPDRPRCRLFGRIVHVPMPHPLALQTYSMETWSRFRDGDALERLRLTDQLASLNYWDRVIFYVDKPERR